MKERSKVTIESLNKILTLADRRAAKIVANGAVHCYRVDNIPCADVLTVMLEKSLK
jgi:hypothetical protein